jgi:hypothetical protein
VGGDFLQQQERENYISMPIPPMPPIPAGPAAGFSSACFSSAGAASGALAVKFSNKNKIPLILFDDAKLQDVKRSKLVKLVKKHLDII